MPADIAQILSKVEANWGGVLVTKKHNPGKEAGPPLK